MPSGSSPKAPTGRRRCRRRRPGPGAGGRTPPRPRRRRGGTRSAAPPSRTWPPVKSTKRRKAGTSRRRSATGATRSRPRSLRAFGARRSGQRADVRPRVEVGGGHEGAARAPRHRGAASPFGRRSDPSPRARDLRREDRRRRPAALAAPAGVHAPHDVGVEADAGVEREAAAVEHAQRQGRTRPAPSASPIWRAAASSRRGSPAARGRTLVPPAGSGPTGSRPATPFSTSFAVPSPANTMTASSPSPTAGSPGRGRAAAAPCARRRPSACGRSAASTIRSDAGVTPSRRGSRRPGRAGAPSREVGGRRSRNAATPSAKSACAAAGALRDGLGLQRLGERCGRRLAQQLLGSASARAARGPGRRRASAPSTRPRRAARRGRRGRSARPPRRAPGGR